MKTAKPKPYEPATSVRLHSEAKRSLLALAQSEQRTISNMAAILISEAISARRARK